MELPGAKTIAATTSKNLPLITAPGFYYNGSICCLCFFIGTIGNIISFLYFRSKKKDMSSVIYMFITANDIVVSIFVLPVGISFLSKGQPGIIFGNKLKYGCETWVGLWNITIFMSIFLVLCLCVTRTVSLLNPFQQQKIRYFLIALVAYLMVNLALIAILNSYDNLHVVFSPINSCCVRFVDIIDLNSKAAFYVIAVNENIFCTAPAIVVAISCVISVVVLTRRNRDIQQRELQRSRNRATVTILLFALLYGVCNLPLVIHNVVVAICVSTNNWQIYLTFYKFDVHFYYRNAENILLAANSAANPILYFWRMPALREYVMKRIRRILGLIIGVRRPARNIVQLAETRRYDTVEENINSQQLVSGYSETRF